MVQAELAEYKKEICHRNVLKTKYSVKNDRNNMSSLFWWYVF